MPVFSGVYGAYGAQGSFNQWFVRTITANGIPSWMPSARVVFDWGIEKPLISGYSGHAFSLNHLGDVEMMGFEGKRADNGTAGQIRHGQVEVNCWVSKSIAQQSHNARLRQMRDMVSRIFTQTVSVPMVDLNASTGTAPSATARLLLDKIEFQSPQADNVNPDIWRIRGVGGYTWIERNG